MLPGLSSQWIKVLALELYCTSIVDTKNSQTQNNNCENPQLTVTQLTGQYFVRSTIGGSLKVLSYVVFEATTLSAVEGWPLIPLLNPRKLIIFFKITYYFNFKQRKKSHRLLS